MKIKVTDVGLTVICPKCHKKTNIRLDYEDFRKLTSEDVDIRTYPKFSPEIKKLFTEELCDDCTLPYIPD